MPRFNVWSRPAGLSPGRPWWQGLDECGLVYLAVTVLRALVYKLHTADGACDQVRRLLAEMMQGETTLRCVPGRHWMSDHILLAASMAAMLSAEAVIGAVDTLLASRASPPVAERRFPPAAAAVPLGIAVLLYELTSWDMFFTAELFHEALESLVSMLLGLVLFQLPVAAWVWRRLHLLTRV